MILITLVACDARTPDFQGGDISSTHLDKTLTLLDHHGQRRQLKDYAGKVLVVAFGYTQCPDICPTSLAELAQVMQALGQDAARVQVLMISIDPERDTPAVMKQYVTAFDPRFVGLTGTPAQIKKVAASFKAYYEKVPDNTGLGYRMDHTSAFYLLDSQGDARVVMQSDTGEEALVHDIRVLLG